MKKLLYSVILPTFNEADAIAELLNAIHKQLKSYPYEILVIDDNSPDGTARIVKKTARSGIPVRSIVNKTRLGLAESIAIGIQEARGFFIIGMDADYNHDPGTLPLLISATKRADLVIASRFIPGGGMYDPFRYYSSLIFNSLIRVLFSYPCRDNTSGYYIIKKQDVLKLQPDHIYRGYGEYHLRLVMTARKKGFRIMEIPTVYPKRLGGTSKSKLWNMFPVYFSVAFSESQ